MSTCKQITNRLRPFLKRIYFRYQNDYNEWSCSFRDMTYQSVISKENICTSQTRLAEIIYKIVN